MAELKRSEPLSGRPSSAQAIISPTMIRKTILLAFMLVALALAETHVIEGTGVTKSLVVMPGDAVTLEAVETDVEITGNGDVFHIDGSDNTIVVHGSFRGIVVTGSANTLTVEGDLPQLDVRGSDNRIHLQSRCDLIQFSGSDNRTDWVQRQGMTAPKIEREGWDNLFTVLKP